MLSPDKLRITHPSPNANSMNTPNEFNDDILTKLLKDIIKYACANVANQLQIEELCESVEENGRWLLDSLSTHQAISFVASFFGLANEKQLNSLVHCTNLAKIRDAAKHQLSQPDVKLTFFTSGTTAKPKAITHTLHDLSAEAAQWRRVIDSDDSVNVFTYVPLNHIYGFIWGALLSNMTRAPLYDIRDRLMLTLDINKPSIVVAIPSMHELLLMMPQKSKANATLILSTEPCKHDALVELENSGYKKVVQIYGSTETGGVGWRNARNSDYTLRKDLNMINGDIYNRLGSKLQIQDTLTFVNDSTFTVGERVDKSIQVNGYNTSDRYVEQKLMALPIVKKAVVQIRQENGRKMLRAELSTHNGYSLQDVVNSFDAELRRALPAQNIHFFI